MPKYLVGAAKRKCKKPTNLSTRKKRKSKLKSSKKSEGDYDGCDQTNNCSSKSDSEDDSEINNINSTSTRCPEKNEVPKSKKAAKDQSLKSCSQCEKMFYRKSLLNIHVMSHLPKEEQPFVCCKCARRFHTEALLKNHERVHLPKEEKFIHPCHLCRKMFSSNSAVSAHLKAVHLGERPFICDQCGHTFTTKGILQEHLTTHSDFSPWICTECDKSFKTKYRLKIHMDVHRPTPYQCPKCPTQLSTRRTLRMHLVVHGDTKAYQCSFCGKAFKRSKDLKNHSNLHTGKKPYTCPFCLRTFANGSNCRSHKRRMHPEELQAYEESLRTENESTSHFLSSFTLPTLGLPLFFESSRGNPEQSNNNLSNLITKSIQYSPVTACTSYKQSLSSCFSNEANRDILNSSLLGLHSGSKDVPCDNKSEISSIPAFPGNPYTPLKS